MILNFFLKMIFMAEVLYAWIEYIARKFFHLVSKSFNLVSTLY